MSKSIDVYITNSADPKDAYRAGQARVKEWSARTDIDVVIKNDGDFDASDYDVILVKKPDNRFTTEDETPATFEEVIGALFGLGTIYAIDKFNKR